MATPWSGATWTPSAAMNAGTAQWWIQQVGSYVWATGTYAGSGHLAFLGFNPTTYALTHEFDTGLGATGLQGTWTTDGTNFYFVAQGSTRIVYKMTAAGSVSTLATLPNQVFVGLTFDGTYLWTVTLRSTGLNWLVHRISLSGTVTTYTNTYTGSVLGGSATVIWNDGTYIYLANANANGLIVIPIATPTSLTALSTGTWANNAFTPGYFDGTNWYVIAAGVKIVKFPSGAGSSTVYSIIGPAAPSGLAYDGTNLWTSNFTNNPGNSPGNRTLFSSLPASPGTVTNYWQYNVSGSPQNFFGANDGAGDISGLGRDNSGNAWAINYNTAPGGVGSPIYQIASTVPAPQGQLVYPFYKRLERRIWAPGWRKHDRLYLPAPVPLGAAA